MELLDTKSTMIAVNCSTATGYAAELYDEFSAFLATISRLTSCRKRVRRGSIFHPACKQWIDSLFGRHREELKRLYKAHCMGDARAEKAAIERILGLGPINRILFAIGM